jgi:hypothetical protein
VVDQEPFTDVVFTERGFSIPELKWRELMFIGVLRPEGELLVRDPTRPLPPFAIPDLFPAGAAFRLDREGERVHLTRVDRPGNEAKGTGHRAP